MLTQKKKKKKNNNNKSKRSVTDSGDSINTREEIRVPLPSRLPNTRSGPWLVFYHGKNREESLTFFSISEGRFYVRSIPQLRKHYSQNTSGEWFLIEESDPFSWRLWNPVTFASIEIPTYDGVGFPSQYEFFLSSSPSDPDCIVMCFHFREQHFVFCRRSRVDNTWIRYNHDIGDDMLGKKNIFNITSYRGKFYGVTPERKIAVFDFDPEPKITVLDIDGPQPTRYCYSKWRHLVESSGELFLIIRIRMSAYDVTGDIEVLKADLSKRKWEEVDDIGDRIFLLNNHTSSLSFSASDLGLKKGCMYFTECWDKYLYVYDLDQGTISRNLPCPNIKRIWRQPFFLMPPAL